MERELVRTRQDRIGRTSRTTFRSSITIVERWARHKDAQCGKDRKTDEARRASTDPMGETLTTPAPIAQDLGDLDICGSA